MKNKKSVKSSVRKVLPESFCVRLSDGSGYIVWPTKIRPRGSEPVACGFGRTARQAWESVQFDEL